MLHENEYLFDVKLFAAIRVKAPDEKTARAMIAKHIEVADCNFGSWPDGEPITGEASTDGPADLIEVNGNAID